MNEDRNTLGRVKKVPIENRIKSERYNPNFKASLGRAKEEVAQGINTLKGPPSGTRYRKGRIVGARTPENARRNAIRLAQEEGTYPKRHWCDPRGWVGCGGATRKQRKSVKPLTRKWKKIGRRY